MTIIERMRERSANVKATAKVVEPLKAVGEERPDYSTWFHWNNFLQAVEKFPNQRDEFAQQFAQQTGRTFW